MAIIWGLVCLVAKLFFKSSSSISKLLVKSNLLDGGVLVSQLLPLISEQLSVLSIKSEQFLLVFKVPAFWVNGKTNWHPSMCCIHTLSLQSLKVDEVIH